MKEATTTGKTNDWYRDLRAEVQQNLRIIDEYYDEEFTRYISQDVISFMKRYYFRARFVGFDQFPERNNPDRPLIYISNHSGMAFPWDGIMMTQGINELEHKNNPGIRPLASPMLSESKIMNPFLFDNLWKIVGSVDASFLNFETMLHQKEKNLLIYPEGVPGIGKGFNKRYQLQRFSSSFLTLSIKYKTDVIPVYTVNGEYINPLAYSWSWLNRQVNKIGIPYLPLGLATPFLFLQPWFFYCAFPAKLTYVLGERIRPYELTTKSMEELSKEELQEIRDKVKDMMQAGLDKAVAQYGKSPYQWREFIKVTLRNLDKFPYPYPFGWPFSFSACKRSYRKRGGGNPMKLRFWSLPHIFLKDPFLFFYYLPVLGWIPIMIKGILMRRKGGKDAVV